MECVIDFKSDAELEMMSYERLKVAMIAACKVTVGTALLLIINLWAPSIFHGVRGITPQDIDQLQDVTALALVVAVAVTTFKYRDVMRCKADLAYVRALAARRAKQPAQ